MTRLVFVFILNIMTLTVWAQGDSFRIIDCNDNTFSEQLTHSLKKSNLDKYRYQHERAVLEFDNNAKVLLLSGDELVDLGIQFNKSVLRKEGITYNSSIFQLHSSGIIVEKLEKVKIK